MGMQIPCGVHPEVSAQSSLQGVAGASGRSVPVAYGAQGMPCRVGSLDDGPCPYAAERAAEACGLAGGRIHQGEKRDPSGEDV